MSSADDGPISLTQLARCFEGAIPAVLATASRSGTPNVTYLSRVHAVDNERIALSNQFMSKTARNLAENPYASLLLIDVVTHDQFRVSITYERTERKGPVFDRLRSEVDAIAAVTGMRDVFRLRAADIYRVTSIEVVPPHPDYATVPPLATPTRLDPVAFVHLTARIARCTEIDALVDVAISGVVELLGHRYAYLMLVNEHGDRLYTIACHGYGEEALGSEVAIGEGMVGLAAQRCAPVRSGNVLQAEKYSRSVRSAYESGGIVGPGRELSIPNAMGVDSRLVVPAMALGRLVGVLVVESELPVAFDDDAEAAVSAIAAQVAGAIELIRASEVETNGAIDDSEPSPGARIDGHPSGESPPSVIVRFFSVDGSVFLGDDYLIKGVAGRLLWALVGHHVQRGRTSFTNKELRLDPSLELPEFKDNFENRLILLKRRLDERGAPIRIERTGRGQFRLHVSHPLVLEEHASG